MNNTPRNTPNCKPLTSWKSGIVRPWNVGQIWANSVYCSDTIRVTQVAGLWARLLTLPSGCCASRIVYYAGLQEHSGAHSGAHCIQAQLCSELGVAHPSSYGLRPNTSRQSLRRWLLHAKCNISTSSDMRYHIEA